MIEITSMSSKASPQKSICLWEEGKWNSTTRITCSHCYIGKVRLLKSFTVNRKFHRQISTSGQTIWCPKRQFSGTITSNFWVNKVGLQWPCMHHFTWSLFISLKSSTSLLWSEICICSTINNKILLRRFNLPTKFKAATAEKWMMYWISR